MWTPQQQINQLLQSSQDYDQKKLKSSLSSEADKKKIQSVQNKNKNSSATIENIQQSLTETQKQNRKYQQASYEETYGQDQFESYDQSRRAIRKLTSKEQEELKKGNNIQNQKSHQLLAIKEEKQPKNKRGTEKKLESQNFNHANFNKKKGNNQKIDLRPASHYKKPAMNLTMDKLQEYSKNLPYNYSQLQQRERQLLLTGLAQQNKRLKSQISFKDEQNKSIHRKYNMLLEERHKNSASARQKVLENQVQNLKNKIQKMHNSLKVKDRALGNTTTGFSQLHKTGQKFVPEELLNNRQQQLLNLIDKLKERLLHSQQQLLQVQKKMNQGLNYTEQLQRKLKRVQQLQFKMQKMVQQAETDRLYIENLKQEVRNLEKRVQQEKKRVIQAEVESKRYRMASQTSNDLVRQLKQVKREKEDLEKALRDMSTTIMGNVRNNFQKSKNNHYDQWNGGIQDSEEMLKTHK